MAYIALRVLLLFNFSSYYCLSQNTEELLFVSVREAVGEIRALSLKVTEMENTMSSKLEEMENTMSSKFEELENIMSSKFEEMENTTSSKVEELDVKMDSMQGQLSELQGSSNVEGVLQLCADTMEMEREFQREIFTQTCNNMDQIANLQESFSTELDRIERSNKGCSSKVSNLQELLAIDECAAADSNDCSPHSSCQDKMILYKCDCDPGYAGDGFTCEDVDECSSTGEQSCHRNAVCNNHPGGYTCTCDRGYYGDGFNCEGCVTDFTEVPGAGCLKVIVGKKTFVDASTHCSTLGAQLIVPQNFQALQDYVDSIPSNHYWIGLINRKWMDGRDVGQEEWRRDQPNGPVTECGYIYLNSHGILDFNCDYPGSFICQLKDDAI